MTTHSTPSTTTNRGLRPIRTLLAVAAAVATLLALAGGPASATALTDARSSAAKVVDASAPQGTLLVIRDFYGQGRLATVQVDGSDLTYLGPQHVVDATFSPDGRRIAFTTFEPNVKNRIYTMDRSGANVELVADTEAFGPHWSPDGTWLVYSECGDWPACSVHKIRSTAPHGAPVLLAQGQLHPTTGVCAGAGNEEYTVGDWHPKLNLVAVALTCEWTKGKHTIDQSHLRLLSGSDGTVVRRLPGNFFSPVFDPSGERLAMVQRLKFVGSAHLFGSSWTGQNIRPLTPLRYRDDANSPVWSPDGRWIGYTKDAQDAWVTNPTGTVHRQLLADTILTDWIAG